MESEKRIREICDRIRQLRVENAGARGKTNFARDLGISPSTYDYYEKGRVPPLELLIRIAELTHSDLGWLLTGKEGTQSVAPRHPAIARAAKLLADHPDFASPLAAFVELLSQTAATFPKPESGAAATEQTSYGAEPAAQKGPETAASEEVSQPAKPPAVKAAVERQPGHPAVLVPAERLVAGTAAAGDNVAYDALGRTIKPSLSERQGWIPILGRSAAGIPHFWRETGGDDGGATALADLVSRMRPRKARRVHQAQARGELAADGSTAQLVLLDAPEPPGTAEFVIAEHISQRYDVVFAVRIDGASMAPEILHGDVVILSPSCPAEQGKPAVVQLAGQIGVTCKLFRIEADRLHLIPINENFPPTDHPLSDLRWALAVIARVRPV